jgi:hypothetical protein
MTVLFAATRAVALAVTLSCAGCDSADRRDAQVVVSAIRRFRSADNPSTPAAVDALKATPCSAPDVCQAKDTCLVAGEATAKALRINSEVQQGLAALDKGTLVRESSEAQELPKKLDESRQLLKKGEEGLPSCDEQVQALKRKHRI